MLDLIKNSRVHLAAILLMLPLSVLGATPSFAPPSKQVLDYCMSAGCDYNIFHQYYQSNASRFCRERQTILSSNLQLKNFKYVLNELKSLNAETSLVVIPIIESSLKSNAVAEQHKNAAVGLWQLKPGTARDMGLKVNSKVDERLSVAKSTKAGVKYINWLKEKYDGDLNLAILAYHVGIGRLNRHIIKFGTKNPWFLSQLISEKNPDKNYLLKYYAYTLSLMGINCA